MKSTTVVTRLSALAQPSRLAIFRLLVRTGPQGLPVGRIAAQLKVSAPTLSFHLKELVHAGLIRARPEGRFIYYAPEFRAMTDLLSYLTENCCGGQACDLTGAASERRAA